MLIIIFILIIGAGISGSFTKTFIPFGEVQLKYNFNDGTARGFVPIRAGVCFKL